MNNFEIHFSSSTDRGRTWSDPVPVHPDVRWGDKPNMAVSPDGLDVYVLFNGPTAGDMYAAVSHDAGATWSTAKVVDSERYYFDYGGVVLPDGRVVFSQISFLYTGPGGAPEGPIQMHLFASDDAGATWTNLIVDELEVGTECTSRSCYEDYYDSGPVLAADEDGDLVIVYNGAAESLGPRTVYARSSVDGGRTWTDRVAISRDGVNSAFAAAVGTGEDEARVWFMDQRSGRWNVWYTTTTDLGATWSAAVKLSDARSGTAYKNRRGFLEPYGDYGEIAITNAGTTVAVWGEGPSYYGPGGVWFNRQR
jgi:Neuraminidase (sialidase)